MRGEFERGESSPALISSIKSPGKALLEPGLGSSVCPVLCRLQKEQKKKKTKGKKRRK